MWFAPFIPQGSAGGGSPPTPSGKKGKEKSSRKVWYPSSSMRIVREKTFLWQKCCTSQAFQAAGLPVSLLPQQPSDEEEEDGQSPIKKTKGYPSGYHWALYKIFFLAKFHKFYKKVKGVIMKVSISIMHDMNDVEQQEKDIRHQRENPFIFKFIIFGLNFEARGINFEPKSCF